VLKGVFTFCECYKAVRLLDVMLKECFAYRAFCLYAVLFDGNTKRILIVGSPFSIRFAYSRHKQVSRESKSLV
jgi:hypothetical protein